MLIAAGLLTWMIFWMRSRARSLRRELEGRTQAALDAGSPLRVRPVVLGRGARGGGAAREGVGPARFLFRPREGSSGAISIAAAVAGGVAAVALGYLFYRG